ncbi:uncharacterized protein L969DRAFT_25305 [Mixia osmundae IAM 14324]|uniref:Methyltransferase domain-containing protein n=1 Tax=Mixia osmundae (strain CBS 9802 / IAM 14324 / JCM 22182 / KY 12970) TaxID=764103 RepID=G7DX09_MIXOS|nr:uncharacterized protein L969DRAFT_25305 [Mixia osmundae IAM 14324]KEI38085.1 hypothetical protein L969DRAFT_25305 [Mixia osmundae IAM 14324]GAA95106.1 hypothetical protein E5Q_01761 [Mixia osmundae IAM 14324]
MSLTIDYAYRSPKASGSSARSISGESRLSESTAVDREEDESSEPAASMREIYETIGPEEYYRQSGGKYKNTAHHTEGIRKVISAFMDRYYSQVASQAKHSISILDLAAGSGEVTLALKDWQKTRFSGSGVAMFQHYPRAKLSIAATDPYTTKAYEARTGMKCMEHSFMEIASGILESEPLSDANSSLYQPNSHKRFDIIFCSFALHLITSSSQLWSVCSELARLADYLVVIAPHKKPEVQHRYGWTRLDPVNLKPSYEAMASPSVATGDGFEICIDKVRLRVYRSDRENDTPA